MFTVGGLGLDYVSIIPLSLGFGLAGGNEFKTLSHSELLFEMVDLKTNKHFFCVFAVPGNHRVPHPEAKWPDHGD